SIAAAHAGKHVLCEKPMARDGAEAKQMLDAVRRAGVKHMVAFNYRFVPAIRQAYELVRGGHLGEIRHFRAAYLQDWITDPQFALGRKNHQVFEINGSKGSLSFNLEKLNELNVYWHDNRGETRGWTEVLVTEPTHPFISHWWPPGHILGWEHSFVHEIAHLLD